MTKDDFITETENICEGFAIGMLSAEDAKSGLKRLGMTRMRSPKCWRRLWRDIA